MALGVRLLIPGSRVRALGQHTLTREIPRDDTDPPLLGDPEHGACRLLPGPPLWAEGEGRTGGGLAGRGGQVGFGGGDRWGLERGEDRCGLGCEGRTDGAWWGRKMCLPRPQLHASRVPGTVLDARGAGESKAQVRVYLGSTLLLGEPVSQQVVYLFCWT